jgi:hypothetical protein
MKDSALLRKEISTIERTAVSAEYTVMICSRNPKTEIDMNLIN